MLFLTVRSFVCARHNSRKSGQTGKKLREVHNRPTTTKFNFGPTTPLEKSPQKGKFSTYNGWQCSSHQI